ncbi:MAG: DUF192 domain-containing protein [Campylobacteraceae bacterium]|jgi:uncharacterized membrane protein (UPF0127 family)|nr:DUF192 domain-containing protein [Campylobacteraceae bacterium]
MIRVFVLSFLLFFNTACSEALPLCVIEFDNGFKIEKLPQANTPKTQQKGLSDLDNIGVGMIFTWSKAQKLSFWMKNTKIALSIGFFDENGKLFQIDDMQPYSLDMHRSKKEAKFALELEQGDFAKHNIAIGAKITKFECK